MLKQVIKADIMMSDIDKTLQAKCEKFGCSIPDWSCCPKEQTHRDILSIIVRLES